MNKNVVCSIDEQLNLISKLIYKIRIILTNSNIENLKIEEYTNLDESFQTINQNQNDNQIKEETISKISDNFKSNIDYYSNKSEPLNIIKAQQNKKERKINYKFTSENNQFSCSSKLNLKNIDINIDKLKESNTDNYVDKKFYYYDIKHPRYLIIADNDESQLKIKQKYDTTRVVKLHNKYYQVIRRSNVNAIISNIYNLDIDPKQLPYIKMYKNTSKYAFSFKQLSKNKIDITIPQYTKDSSYSDINFCIINIIYRHHAETLGIDIELLNEKIRQFNQNYNISQVNYTRFIDQKRWIYTIEDLNFDPFLFKFVYYNDENEYQFKINRNLAIIKKTKLEEINFDILVYGILPSSVDLSLDQIQVKQNIEKLSVKYDFNIQLK